MQLIAQHSRRRLGRRLIQPVIRTSTWRRSLFFPPAGIPQARGDVRFSNRPIGSSAFRLSTTTVPMSLAGSRFSSESAPGPFHHGIRGRGGTIFGAALPSSLIGRLGSSAFRLSTSTVSMSLAGSRFSSESAPGPFHHGIRGRGGTIFGAALPSYRQQVQADIRTRLIHRPARDIIPPLRWSSSVLLSCLILRGSHAAAVSRVHRNSVPSTQMRCMITANRRASATIAFFIPRCLAIFMAQALSQDHFARRTSMIWAAS